LEHLFSSLLHHSARQVRVVVLVDALNQFLRTERSEALTWLPALWPDNARFLATAIPSPESRSLSRKPGIVLSHAMALPETLDGVYGELIRQVEKLSGPGQTRAFCSLIALSRNGWRKEDFQHLLPGAAGVLCPEAPNHSWDPLRFAILR
jgi:hypothetical protein